MLKYFLLFLFILSTSPVLPCSAFNIPNSSEKIFAKSYDWHVGFGYAFTNKRDVKKQQLMLGKDHKDMKSLEWTSKYGSVTFSQHGREMPISGMNEEGLMIEVLMLKSSEHMTEFNQPTLNELQWVQYQLDTAASTKEAIANAKKITVKKRVAPLHYMVCDKLGECATFEYLNKKLVIHSGKDLKVSAITNSTYDESLEFYEDLKKQNKKLPQSWGSTQRFSRLADHIGKYDKSQDAFAYMQAALKKVKKSVFTKWQIIYQPLDLKIFFKHRKSKHGAWIHLDDFDFGCDTPVQMSSLKTKHKSKDTDFKFREYKDGTNRRLVYAANLSLGQKLKKDEVKKISGYPKTTECVNP